MTDTEKKEMLDSLKGIVHEANDAALKDNKEALDKAIADYDARFDKLEAKLETVNTNIGTPIDAKSKAQRETFNKFLRNGISAVPQDTLTSSVSEDGGFLIPEEISSQILSYSKQNNPMRELASQITVGTDNYSILDAYGDAGGGWVGEEDSRTATDTPNAGKITIYTHEMYANPKATQKEIDDSIINIDAWVSDFVGKKFAAIENAGFINGIGTTQPQGLLQYAKVADASWARGKMGYIVSGSATAVSVDNLIDMQDALADDYAQNSAWLMAKGTFTALRKLKAGSGGANMSLLWTPELINGRLTNTLLGSPVYKCSQMDAISDGKYPIALGDFKQGYLIVDRIGVRVIRDTYSSKPYVEFYTTKRVGGGVTNSEAIKLLKTAAS